MMRAALTLDGLAEEDLKCGCKDFLDRIESFVKSKGTPALST